MKTKINRSTDALIIIDPQNDFCPGGALAVNDGDAIMTGINDLAKLFETIVISQDWHPANHKSFASAHGLDPFSTVAMPYGEQTLWPDHCVQGTPGADFHPAVAEAVNRASAIIRKGMNPEVDSYSAFYENDRETTTGLGAYLATKGIERVFFVGLAFDYCVAYSAIDATYREKLEAFVVEDLTRAIDLNDSAANTVEEFKVADVYLVNSSQIA